MKIIKLGEIKQENQQIICKSCQTEFKIEPNDIQSDRDGRYVICTLCGKFISV